MSAQVLIIEDDPVQRRLIEATVSRMGFHPVPRDGGAAGIAALADDRTGEIAAVVLDLIMPGVSGLDVLAEMRRLGRTVPVVVLTARGGVETVVEAMRAGAFDFVVKPVPPEKLSRAIGLAVRMHHAERKGRARTQKPGGPRPFDPPASPAMAPVVSLAAKAAASSIPTLIEGETGVGKEWLAEAIRAAGPRARAPFVVVNCGALPVHLVESLLFGHEKGAFTDAGERREGKFVEADGGTLFLDEIGELPLEVQVKLLRVLQKGEIDPVGGRAPIRTDVRIISATNRDLAADMRSGRFREDLFYRLNVLPIRMPPLRERRAEIADLARRFLGHFVAGESSSPARRFSAAAVDLLERYDWPGNIRQLENAVYRAVVLAQAETIDVHDFPQIAAFLPGAPVDRLFSRRQGDAVPDGPALPLIASPPLAAFDIPRDEARTPELAAFDAAGHVRTADAVEADLIRMAMARYRGRMSEVARRLGIGRSTLYRKMRRYSIAEPDAPDPGEGAETLSDTAIRTLCETGVSEEAG